MAPGMYTFTDSGNAHAEKFKYVGTQKLAGEESRGHAVSKVPRLPTFHFMARHYQF